MKKKYLLIPSLLAVGLLGLASCGGGGSKGNTYYISPTGDAENKGTKDSPLDAHTGFEKIVAGDTLKVLPGRYSLEERIYVSQSGSAGQYITVENDSDTEAAIFDFSALEFLGTNRGISLNGDYWHFDNIEVTGAGDNGMYIGGSYNIIENCLFYENRDTGLQLGRANGGLIQIKNWPSYNLIKNCTSFNNYDDETFGENADGFAAKLTVGYGNVFDGCIAYRNSDDGWDLFAKQDSGNIGTVILYNCVSFENGFLLNKTTEAGVERFVTRDGDGIGFKLGGSTMKGDVILNNCVTFNNRLQGVGDNSNPGVISVNNVTAYNNCAAIDENGKVIKDGDNDKESSNFDLARSTASYNNYSNLLSYVTNKSAQADRYLGSMRNSILYTGAGEYTRFEKAVDASYYGNEKGTKYEGMSDDIFESIVAPDGLNNRSVHKDLRNPDGSVQLGNFLKLKEGALKDSGIGADLTKTSYEEYEHYKLLEFDETLSYEQQQALSVYSALEVNCNPSAVFQDMLVPAEMSGCTINWISSRPDIISVGEEPITSLSDSTEILLTVYRPSQDTEVTLTAQIEIENVLKTKTFVLTVVKDAPSIGNVEVQGLHNGVISVEQFSTFEAPKIVVTNGSSYSGKELPESLYDLNITYMYAPRKDAYAYPVDGIYTSKDGAYTVTYEVVSKVDETDKKSGSYIVYVTSPTSEVNYTNVKVNASRDGFAIVADLSNPTGIIYTYASTNATETLEDVIEKGEQFRFFADSVDIVYNHANDAGYFVHTVVTNTAGYAFSEVYTAEIKTQEISTAAELMSLLGGNSVDNSTIYLLTKDIDFTNTNWTGSGTFKGLLNGAGHKISNITTNQFSLVNKLEGTIMNINFENINLNASWDGATDAVRVGLVGTMSGGYIHNVHIKNINARGSQRVGGLVGQVDKGNNYITQISVVNDSEHLISGERSGGIIGFIQDANDITEFTINLENIHVQANIGNNDNYVGGIIGRYDNRQTFMVLSISKVVYSGHVTAKTYAGGIIGGFTNGNTKIIVKNCMSNFSCTYNNTPFTIALKNCSPIIGHHATATEEDLIVVENNFGPVGEYNEFYDSTSARFESNFINKLVYSDTLKFDLENIWIFDDTTFTISLR